MATKLFVGVVVLCLLFFGRLTLGADCLWDCDEVQDNEVGITDFLAVLGTWGQVGVACDVEGDGVDIEDLLGVLATWGPCLSESGNVVLYDNSNGEFLWVPTYDTEFCDPMYSTFLDVTSGPSQIGDLGDETYSLHYSAAQGTPHFDAFSITSQCAEAGPIKVVADDEPTVILDETGTPVNYYFVRELGPGDCVDGSTNLRSGAALVVTNYYTDPWVEVMIDTPTYIGVSFVRNGDVHYGWILFDAVDNAPAQFLSTPTAVMWAYETTPGMPITIPE